MTANATKKDRQQCFDAGMNDFITKPIYPDELLSVIRKYVKDQWSERGKLNWSERGRNEESERGKGQGADARPKVFDRQDFLIRLGGDEPLLKFLMPSFPKHLGERMRKLKTALERKDAADIKFQAHAIKGTSATYSANRIRDIASAMEQAGRDGRVNIAISLMEGLEQEVVELQLVLSEMFPENNTKGNPASLGRERR
jgi:HPt (histidine-containing phosphotransfer) domain-containing protein